MDDDVRAGSQDLVGLKLEHYDHCDNIEVHAKCRVVHADKGFPQSWILNEMLDITDSQEKYVCISKSTQRFGNSNTSLTVQLKVKITEKIQISMAYPKLGEDLEVLLKGDIPGDVTLVVADKEICKAHKAILMARSPVFVNMFTCDMLEKKTNMVEIKDIESETFQGLLLFVYTGKMQVTDVIKSAALLTAADKYAIDELKSLCEDNLIRNLGIDTAADILILTELVRSERLKTKAMNFILANKNQVIETDSYKDMIKSHVHFVEEMFRKATLK